MNQLPSGRKLAAELGVSYLTARRAISHLIDRGELVRQENGRLQRASQTPVRQKQLNIAFLAPANDSASSNGWRMALSEEVEARGGLVRPISYVHPDDPVITEALNSSFDGLFFVQPKEVATVLRERLARERHRLVMVLNGADDLEIPCLDGGAPDAIDKLVDHLKSLGHTRVDCLNSMHRGSIVTERIERWHAAIDRAGLDGDLYEQPCQFMVNPAPLARELALGVWADRPKGTAVFTPIVDCAHGLYRAAWERGLRVGSDVSICSFGSVQRAKLFTPSLTTVITAELRPLIARGLDWIVSGGQDWQGPWKLAPTDLEVFKGESTGPPTA